MPMSLNSTSPFHPVLFSLEEQFDVTEWTKQNPNKYVILYYSQTNMFLFSAANTEIRFILWHSKILIKYSSSFSSSVWRVHYSLNFYFLGICVPTVSSFYPWASCSPVPHPVIVQLLRVFYVLNVWCAMPTQDWMKPQWFIVNLGQFLRNVDDPRWNRDVMGTVNLPNPAKCYSWSQKLF